MGQQDTRSTTGERAAPCLQTLGSVNTLASGAGKRSTGRMEAGARGRDGDFKRRDRQWSRVCWEAGRQRTSVRHSCEQVVRVRSAGGLQDLCAPGPLVRWAVSLCSLRVPDACGCCGCCCFSNFLQLLNFAGFSADSAHHVRRLHSSTYAQYVHRIASHTKSTYRGFVPSGTGGGGAPELTGVARISCLLGGGGGGAFLRPGASGSPWDIVRLGCCGGGGPWSAGDF